MMMDITNSLADSNFCPGAYLAAILDNGPDIENGIDKPLGEAVAKVGIEENNQIITPQRFLYFGSEQLNDLNEKLKSVKSLCLNSEGKDTYELLESLSLEFGRIQIEKSKLKSSQLHVEQIRQAENTTSRLRMAIGLGGKICIGPHLSFQILESVKHMLCIVDSDEDLMERASAILQIYDPLIVSELGQSLLMETDGTSILKSQRCLYDSWFQINKFKLQGGEHVNLPLLRPAYTAIKNDILSKKISAPKEISIAIKYVMCVKGSKDRLLLFFKNLKLRNSYIIYIAIEECLLCLDPSKNEFEKPMSISTPRVFWYTYIYIKTFIREVLISVKDVGLSDNLCNMLKKFEAKWKTKPLVQVLLRNTHVSLMSGYKTYYNHLADTINAGETMLLHEFEDAISPDLSLRNSLEIISREFDSEIPYLNIGILDERIHTSLVWQYSINNDVQSCYSHSIMTLASKISVMFIGPFIRYDGTTDEGFLLFQNHFVDNLRHLANFINALSHYIGGQLAQLLSSYKERSESIYICLYIIITLYADIRTFQKEFVGGVFWQRLKSGITDDILNNYNTEIPNCLDSFSMNMSHKWRVVEDKLKEKFQTLISEKMYSSASLSLKNSMSAMALLDIDNHESNTESLWVHEILNPFTSILSICEKDSNPNLIRQYICPFFHTALIDVLQSIFQYALQLRTKYRLSLKGAIGSQYALDLCHLLNTISDIYIYMNAPDSDVTEIRAIIDVEKKKIV